MNFKELRRGMIVLANTFDEIRSSRETALAKTSTQKAMMWCGTYMKYAQLGEDPYAENNGNRKTVADIKSMLDATDKTLSKDILEKGLIYTVDQMREYFGAQIDSLMEYITDGQRLQENEHNLEPKQIVHTNLCLSNIYTNLTEARMWLGMELGRIREHGEAETTL